MAGAKMIKHILIERNMTIKELGATLGLGYQTMRNKQYRDTYSLAEFLKIMDILDCDVIVKTRDTNQIIKF